MDLLNNEEVLSESNYIPATPAKSVPTKRTLISVFNGEGAAAFESLIDVPVALLTPFTENSASVSSNKIDTPSLAPITPDKDGSRDMLQDVALEERIDLNKKVSFRDVNLASGEDEEEETQGIDLNKTPRKKFTRRKKHRPKVIQEGKPTKSPMPATPKIAEDKEKPLRTRSYVRRNKASNSSKTPSDSSEEDEDKEKPLHKRTYVRRNKSLNSLNTQLCKTEENKESPIPIKTYARRKKVQIGETTDPCSLNPSNATKSVRRSLDFSSPEGETKDEHHISTPSDVDNTVCSRKFTVEFNQGLEVVVTESPSGIAFDLNRSINEVLDEYIRLPTSSDQEKFEYCNRSDDILINDIDTTGIKRKHDYINAGCGGTKETNSCQEMNGLSPDFPMIIKKRRTHRGKALGCNNELLRKLSTCYSFTDVPQLTDFDRFQQLELTLALPSIEGATRKRSEIPTRARTPIAGAGDCNHLLWSPEQPKQNNVRKEKYILAPETCMDALFADTRYNITKRQRNKGHFRLVGSVFDNMKRECTVASSRFSFLGQPFVLGLEANAPFYPQTAVSYLDPVEIIVAKMRRMKITDDHQVKSLSETENALIPFNGGGMMVPYRHLFDLIRKRGARAKVDLDPETNRVWNLLMGKKSNEADDVDEDKEKWWENERQIFRGRADAFIARMHLILGDRRFSKWKGSVVDSVVGVFLTQNVTDHLSSSAFMSLAAKFPPQPEDNSKDKNEECIETSTESLGDTNWQEKMSMPEAIDPGSIGAHEKEKAATDLSSSHESNNRNETDYSKGNDLNFHGREQEIDHEGIVSPATSMSQIIQNSSNTDPVEVENVCVLRERIGPCLTSTSVEITEIYDINVIEDDSGSRLMPANSITTMAVESSSKTENSLREKHKLLQMHDELNILTETQHHGEQTANVSSCNDFEMLETMKEAEVNMKNEACSSQTVQPQNVKSASRANKVNAKTHVKGWKGLQKEALADGASNQRSSETMDSLDWEAVRNADVNEISHTIRERGMNNVLAGRIKDFLNRLVKDHGSIDLEWLRHVPPDRAKDYLLSIRGLGIKSVECVRLLTLHHLAFPVDTNVGRICVRLGWVPLQPLPESLQLHLLELYPMIEHIQKYLWPRLCTLDQRTLYELHYQMITFGKVFCTKTKPNCNACPMRGECKHFASAFTSAKLALPGPEEKRLITSTIPSTFENDGGPYFSPVSLPQLESSQPTKESARDVCEPIIEEPDTPEPDNTKDLERDIEDSFYENLEEIPTIKLSLEDFKNNIKTYMQENNIEIEDGDMSKALVAITAEAASIPMSKLKNVNRLRTEHQVYELPDSHPLLEGVDQRVPDDPCPYLLAIWTPGETAQSTEPPQSCCDSQGSSKLCKKATCFACNSIREALAQTVRGTLLIPCRTAMKGSFPLNGTYFQVNEVFADHNSSRKPINVPREWIWNLPRRTVFFGTSVSTIFKGLPMEDIQHCFWRGFVCVRGFDRASRAPKPLYARLHFPPSKAVKNNKDTGKGKEERYINKML